PAQPREMFLRSVVGRACGDIGRLDFVGERLKAAPRADPIDESLCENRPEPRRQAAAAVKILKQRPAFAAALLQAVQLGAQRVGQLTGAAARIESVGSTIKHRPVLEDEALPGLLVSRGALA